jgi:hypothetical protein
MYSGVIEGVEGINARGAKFQFNIGWCIAVSQAWAIFVPIPVSEYSSIVALR